MAQTKPKAAQFYGVSDNGTDGQFLKTDGTGGMSWASTIVDPIITSIDYPGTQTAADPAGGESVIINGTRFASGVTCTVGGTSAVTAFNSATQITITTPAKAAGQYAVAVTNPDGGTTSQANFIQYSGVPVWSTAAGNLGSVQDGATASFQVTATEGSDTIEYAVTTGSLPSGLSLNTNTGAITGTAPSVSASTTTTFSITATDDENQTSSARSFNITVTPDVPSNHFNTVLYNGNGGTQAITGLNFQPDFVWVKRRDNGIGNTAHLLFDSVRGAGERLSTNNTSAQSTFTDEVTSFDTNGFSVGADASINGSGGNLVAWNFKAGGAAVANTDGGVTSQVSVNNTLGFSIVDYTAPGGTAIGHGLNGAPDLIILKSVNATEDWLIYNSISGTGNYLSFSRNGGTDAVVGRAASFSSVTATTFTDLWTSASLNWIAYCFKSQPGFSKVGSYTGNNVTNNVQTGFEPAFLLIKNISAGYTNNWIMVDNKRSPINQRKQVLNANLSNAESTETVNINFLTNGFQLTNGNSAVNDGSATYLYLAFAADPSTTTPSLANSFDTELYTGNASTNQISTVGFAPDFTWIKARNTATANELHDSVRGEPSRLWANENYAASTAYNGFVKLTSNGFDLNNVGSGGNVNRAYNYVSWNWKAGGLASINTDGSVTSLVSANQAAGFSIVEYTGNATSGATIAHGLGVDADMVMVKSTNLAQAWNVYIKDITDTSAKYLRLNQSDGMLTTTNPRFIPNNFTSDVFSVGSDNSTNGNNDNYIAYCFTSIAGYSKVGTYTGNGTAGHNITTGFAAGFLMIKRTSVGHGDWYIFDNKRKTGVYSDQLRANTSATEATGTYVSINATGFALNTTASDLNNNSDTFIYLAIKEN